MKAGVKAVEITNRKTGLLISMMVAILVNFHQVIVVLFNLTPPSGGPVRPMVQLEHNGLDLLVNLIYSFVLAWSAYEINFYLLKRVKGWVGTVVRVLVTMVVGAFLATLVFYLYSLFAGYPQEMEWGIKMHFRGKAMLITFLMLGLTHIRYLNRRNSEQHVEMERLATENARSQYLALKNQVDPHFLFNSLNTLNGLIDLDAQRAQEYVQRLSVMFRYSMQDRELVTVAEEVEFAQNFGELMTIRYGDALTFVYNIDEEFMSRHVLPFSIQTLMENAVKHNVITAAKPLRVGIFSDMVRDCIVVENQISPKREPESGEGIGLVNLSRRYELLGYKPIEITQSNETFSVSLPIIE